MKKVLLSLFFTTIIFIANAQVNKGAILLGGTVSAGSSKTEDNNQNAKGKGFSIRPSVGYAYKTNYVFGISLGYGTGKTETNTGSYLAINRTKSYGGGIYLRRYFPIAGKFSLFGQGDLSYDYQRTTSTNTAPFGANYIIKNQRFGLYFSPGATYAVSKKIMIETSFGNLLGVQYLKTETKFTGSSPSTGSKQNQFTVNGDAFPAYGINLGFRFVLGNK